MAYTKQVWKDLPNETTPLSAERLNHMETQYDAMLQVLGSVSVLDFGADPSGGVSSSKAIADALRESAGKRSVILPPGDYLVDTVIPLPSDSRLVGYGATIRKVSGAPTAVFGTYREGGSLGYGSGGSRIHVEGVKFLGDFSSGRGIGLGGFHHTDHLTVLNCVFEQAITFGHIIDLQGCRYVLIQGCVFRGADPTGGDSRKSNEAIQLDYSTRIGASVVDDPLTYDGLPTTDVRVTQCHFLDLQVDGKLYPAPNPLGSHATVEDFFIDRIQFDRNTVRGWGEDGTNAIRGALHFVAARNVSITNNLFIAGRESSFAVATWPISRAFPLSSVSDPEASSVTIPAKGNPGFQVKGNSFQTNPEVGGLRVFCAFRGPSSDHSGPNVSGNSFQGEVSAQCIETFNHSGSSFSSNNFLGSRRGIYASGEVGLQISNNSATQCTLDVFNVVGGRDVSINSNESVDCVAVLYSTAPGVVVSSNVSHKSFAGSQVAYDLSNSAGSSLMSNRHSHTGGGSPVIFRMRGASSGISIGNSYSGGTVSFVPEVQEAYNFSG